MEEKPVNISHANNVADACNDVADILDFLSAVLCWVQYDKSVSLSPKVITGLWHILEGCSCTLRRIQ